MNKKKMQIIYEDKFIIVVDKPAHLLTIATQNEKERTMFHQVITYERAKNKNNKVFIVHRLDKDTSGLLIFAKNQKIKEQLQANWNHVKREYIAVVEGVVEKNENTIKSYLTEEKNFIVHSTTSKKGELAITKYKKKHSDIRKFYEYKKLNISKSYSLLQIEILTGKKNQIRVHMKEMNHPIIGDKKYGAKTNPLKRLGLHANILEFEHPVTHQIIHLESKVPMEFMNMFSIKK